jgi:hypothetical protein
VKALGWLSSKIPFVVLGFVFSEVFHHFRLIKIDRKVSVGELFGFFLTLFLAYLVSSRWKTLQFGKESAKKLLLDMAGEFRSEFNIVKADADFLGLNGHNEDKFQSLLRGIKSLRNRLAEIDDITQAVFKSSWVANLSLELTSFKQLTTSQKNLPLSIREPIAAQSTKLRRALADLQAKILNAD